MKWEEDFNNYKLIECGKWKIDRVLAKQFISSLITQMHNDYEECLPKTIPHAEYCNKIMMGEFADCDCGVSEREYYRSQFLENRKKKFDI